MAPDEGNATGAINASRSESKHSSPTRSRARRSTNESTISWQAGWRFVTVFQEAATGSARVFLWGRPGFAILAKW